jgi:hypothetical protein
MRKPNICLYGNLETGKTTTAKYLRDKYGYEIHSFASGVREMSCEVLATMTGMSIEDCWEKYFTLDYGHYKRANIISGDLKLPGHRQFLQGIGNAARNIIGENVWVEAMNNKLKKQGFTEEDKSFVIDDCRYPNEAATMQFAWEALVIYLERPGSDKEHPSEWCAKYVESGEVKPDIVIPYGEGTEGTQRIIDNTIEEYAGRTTSAV